MDINIYLFTIVIIILIIVLLYILYKYYKFEKILIDKNIINNSDIIQTKDINIMNYKNDKLEIGIDKASVNINKIENENVNIKNDLEALVFQVNDNKNDIIYINESLKLLNKSEFINQANSDVTNIQDELNNIDANTKKYNEILLDNNSESISSSITAANELHDETYNDSLFINNPLNNIEMRSEGLYNPHIFYFNKEGFSNPSCFKLIVNQIDEICLLYVNDSIYKNSIINNFIMKVDGLFYEDNPNLDKYEYIINILYEQPTESVLLNKEHLNTYDILFKFYMIRINQITNYILKEEDINLSRLVLTVLLA